MVKKIIIFIVGILTGALISCFFYWKSQDYKYVILQKDYILSGNMGTIRKGAMIKIDRGFSEGFTRYILYLNIRDNESVEDYVTQEKTIIHPYWLKPADSVIIGE